MTAEPSFWNPLSMKSYETHFLIVEKEEFRGKKGELKSLGSHCSLVLVHKSSCFLCKNKKQQRQLMLFLTSVYLTAPLRHMVVAHPPVTKRV